MDDGAPTAVRAALARLELVPGGVVSRDTARYVKELAQSPLEAIEQQPAQQQAAASMLRHQLADVCMRNTSMFVQAQDAFDGVPACTQRCASALDALAAPRARAVSDAARAFEHAAHAALAQRAALLQLEETYETTLQRVLQLPRAVHACVVRGDDEEALALARDALGAVPASDALGAALVAEVGRALDALRARLLGALCEPRRALPHVRRVVRLLDALAELARGAFPGSALCMARAEVCAAFLAARHAEVVHALRGDDVLRAIDAWRSAALGACACALAVFVDGEREDRAAALTTAAFAAQCVDALDAYVDAALGALVRRSRAWEDTGRMLGAVHARMAAAAAAGAAHGVALEGVQARVADAALALWTRALRAVYDEAVGPPERAAGAAWGGGGAEWAAALCAGGGA
ncbi:hypothetical protein MOBT1_000013 [Malassezia obtusa]|uniref:Conserved oligomeric Golgi complex subunit 8 n=1 Tax=Malassezia obtusa TaxID=76774 RepID=A0AAF0DWE9_9BASI|nr:hypothetical protein MOBT1_000013 [Malassezia obtusa]